MADSTSTDSTVQSAFTSGSINVSGLGNGTDFNSLIDGLITAEKVHINRLTAWKSEWTAKVTQFQNLNTKMLALKTTLTGMDTMNEFMTKAVSSSNDYALTASADSSAGKPARRNRCDSWRGLICLASADSSCSGRKPTRAIQWPHKVASAIPSPTAINEG